MVILFDASRPVKINRTHRFAAGLTPRASSTHPAAHEEAEYLDMVADRDQARRDFDQHLEERAMRAWEMDRVCRGSVL